ncbi:MAG TPA: 23S rRNA (pseudouridine(1915)-N(3))-methyltransferase RlmH [Sphingomonadaceae bacterium]|nr:23S rRNA (pseudouridine(1915)-N(3))-methyltransferase RlmH [Sphingomonadaceae bacterium]
MRLHIVARGKIGRGPERELVETYLGRIRWPVQVSELGMSDPLPERAPGTRVVALDERGTPLSSMALAETLRGWRDGGTREARFLLGAADGLGDAARDGADLLMSFGAATWPHLLARAMLAEQLFRATGIIAGHPYHREG